MADAIVTAKSRTIFKRSSFGRFAAECDVAATKTVEDTIKLGAATSRSMAPASGYNVASYSKKPGYVPLRRSIRTRMRGATSGEWYSIAPHALFIELGTAGSTRHMGKARFYWKGGLFVWNRPEFGPIGSGKDYENWDATGVWIRHPGNNANPFLEPAYDRVVKRQMLDIAKHNYPG